MASLDELHIPGIDALRRAIPMQRAPAERARIADDDKLIESIRCGRQPDDDADPLIRMLAAWRSDAMEGT